jgi:hypothetical protein
VRHVDSTGHLFLNHNPGRYHGVIILNPSPARLQQSRQS